MVNLVYSDLIEKQHYHTSYHVNPLLHPDELTSESFRLILPGIRLKISSDGTLNLNYEATFPSGKYISLKGTLSARKAVVFHGDNGYSRKGSCSTCASHYLSYTRLQGIVKANKDGREETFYALSWHDHEFGSQTLSSDQIGWNWFGIQLNSKEEFMLFSMRNRDENQTPFQSGTHILASGEVVNIPGKDIKMEPIALSESGKGIFYPTTWRIKLSGRLERSFMVKANNPHQISNSHLKNFPNYWEGSSDVLASDGKTLLGHAFLEMTGYDPDAIPKF